ncbi:MAG: outer membrane beta-barrel protein [Woeseiaceae bacterium]|nr:outer membrane beta-barrel protein [Woeseiaceae bacterium]
MKRVLVFAFALLGIAGTASAEFNYNFVQATYGQIDFDDINVDGDNFGIDLSLAINDEFHLFGGADFSDLDFNVDATSWEAGVGWNNTLTPIVDIVARASFQSIDIDTNFGNADDTGLGIGVGLRAAVTDLLELNGSIEYVDFDDSGDNTTLNAAALFNFTERFSVGLTGSFDDDVELISLAGRIYF